MKGAMRIYTSVKQDKWNTFLPSFMFVIKTDGLIEYVKELFHWSCIAEILL